ncbi:hypothetical protein WJ31_25610 [Burkholderia ubonensis]|nr:hypothetical protein WJ31_25610 [Burkholderia ubonensis]KVT84739.1 hypothetical protein WK58_30330 [Burkholderia ubonensis]
MAFSFAAAGWAGAARAARARPPMVDLPEGARERFGRAARPCRHSGKRARIAVRPVHRGPAGLRAPGSGGRDRDFEETRMTAMTAVFGILVAPWLGPNGAHFLPYERFRAFACAFRM